MLLDDLKPFPLVAWLDRRSRAQRWAGVALVAAFALYRFARFGAGQLLDRWWYAELTDSPIWGKRLGAQVLLGAVSGLVSLALMVLSNRRALRTEAPADQKTFRPIALVAARLGPATRWLGYALPLWFAALIAGAATSHWQQWLMFTSSRHLDVEAPVVGYDLSYHLFRLPFLSTVTAWLMALLATTLAMAALVFVLRGALRLPFRGRHSSRQATAHLAILGAAWFAIRAFDYWFVKYPSLASRQDGRFHGAGWALMHGPGIAYRPLALACLAAAVTLAAYAFGRIRVPLLGSLLATILIAHLALVSALPWVLERTVVAPAQAERDGPYHSTNLEATKAAYALEGIDDSERVLTDAGIDPAHARRTPLFDTDQLADAFQILQGTRGTRVHDVDLDRYGTDDGRRPVFVAARELAAGELPESGWVQEHLVYTHGDGAIVAAADTVDAAGVLAFDDLAAEVGLTEPDLYFGESVHGWYAFTDTKRSESGDAAFTGDNGVRLGSTTRRLVAALALGDYNLAATSEFTPDTQLLYRRSLEERVHALAPFLVLDSDPYPVVADGHIVWVVDAYTTADTYPYAQFTNASRADHPVNYLRRAALVTVDGYDGSVHIYRADGAAPDPVLDLWGRILPGLLEDPDTMPAEISAHRRFGSDLFVAQTDMLAQYHVDDGETLFAGTDSWVVSPAAGTAADDSGTGAAPAVTLFDSGGDDAAWVSYRVFSTGAAGNASSARLGMVAIAIGDHSTGELRLVRLERADGDQVTSPRVAQSLIAADPDVSQLMTLLNANGSKVLFGPMTPIIDEDSLAWIRPLIVVGTTGTATPRLHTVLAVMNGQVGMGADTTAALADALDT